MQPGPDLRTQPWRPLPGPGLLPDSCLLIPLIDRHTLAHNLARTAEQHLSVEIEEVDRERAGEGVAFAIDGVGFPKDRSADHRAARIESKHHVLQLKPPRAGLRPHAEADVV